MRNTVKTYQVISLTTTAVREEKKSENGRPEIDELTVCLELALDSF